MFENIGVAGKQKKIHHFMFYDQFLQPNQEDFIPPDQDHHIRTTKMLKADRKHDTLNYIFDSRYLDTISSKINGGDQKVPDLSPIGESYSSTV